METLLFFMGEFYPFSGLKEVAQSVVARPVGGHSVKLLAVGRGKLQPELERLGSTDPVRGRILLSGWQPYRELPRYVAAADICLLPAYRNDVMRDIVPIKVYEYLAAGKPVISTRLPGVLREFGEDHGIVYVDDPGDVLPLPESGPHCGAAERELALEEAQGGAAKKLLDKTKYFDEGLEWKFYELWHHEGRRARMGAAMMAPDYTWWHGFFELKKHFCELSDEAQDMIQHNRKAVRCLNFPGTGGSTKPPWPTAPPKN